LLKGKMKNSLEHFIDRKRAWLPLALAIGVVFSVAFAVILAAGALNHDCHTGEENGCLPCLQIEAAKRFFPADITSFFCVHFLIPVLFYLKYTGLKAHYPASLIAIKVRFNT